MKQLTSQRPFHVVPEPMIDDNNRLIQMLILSRVHSSLFSLAAQLRILGGNSFHVCKLTTDHDASVPTNYVQRRRPVIIIVQARCTWLLNLLLSFLHDMLEIRWDPG